MLEKYKANHPGKSKFVSIVMFCFSYLYSKIRYKIHLEGTENIVKSGPVLLLAKHQRIDDVILGYNVLYHYARKDLWAVMKDALAAWYFFGFFLRCGGLPINRNNPEKSKEYLLLGRKVLHEGRMVVIFPEQTVFPGRMGRGRTPGFRFVAGRPKEPVSVNVIGFRYKKAFPRTEVFMRIGKSCQYDIHDDPEDFLHERMHEMAELSLLTYPFKKPEKEKGVSAPPASH